MKPSIKRIALTAPAVTLAAALPGVASAHGLHGPVHGVAAHAAAHLLPALVLIVAAGIALHVARRARK